MWRKSSCGTAATKRHNLLLRYLHSCLPVLRGEIPVAAANCACTRPSSASSANPCTGSALFERHTTADDSSTHMQHCGSGRVSSHACCLFWCHQLSTTHQAVTQTSNHRQFTPIFSDRKVPSGSTAALSTKKVTAISSPCAAATATSNKQVNQLQELAATLVVIPCNNGTCFLKLGRFGSARRCTSS